MKYQILGSWVNDKGKASRAPRRRPEVLSQDAAIAKLAELIEMYPCCSYQVVPVEE